jgi:uncharacterized membrane protein
LVPNFFFLKEKRKKKKLLHSPENYTPFLSSPLMSSLVVSQLLQKLLKKMSLSNLVLLVVYVMFFLPATLD